jgi:glycosyltransferase involved in cell wall biosynthesis
MSSTISVAIPTRNHPTELAACLQSLIPCRDKVLEIIVVDNNSDGCATRQIAEQFGAIYIHEPVVGLEAARNRAIASAQGDVIAFTDDDCQVSAEWIDAIAESFADLIVGAVTGRATCGPDSNWVQRQFDEFRGLCSPEPIEMSRAEVGNLYYRAVLGIGANIACRRQLLLALQGFPHMFVRCGEDDYILYSIVRAGYTVRYTPRSIVYQQHRSTLGATLRRIGQYGIGTMRVLWYLSAEDHSFLRFLKNVLWMYKQNLRQLGGCVLRRRGWHVLFSCTFLAGFTAGTFLPWGWRAHITGKLPTRGVLPTFSA